MKDTKFGEICKELMAIGLLEHSKTIKMDKISPEVREGLTGPQYAYRVSLKAIRPLVQDEQKWRKMLGLYKDNFTPEEMDELCLTPHVMDDDRTRNAGEPPRNAGESPRNTGTYKNNTRRDTIHKQTDENGGGGFVDAIIGLLVEQGVVKDSAEVEKTWLANVIRGKSNKAVWNETWGFIKSNQTGIKSPIGVLISRLKSLPMKSDLLKADSQYGKEVESKEDRHDLG